MHTRTDDLYTIVTDQDLHDRSFCLAWYHGNSHIDITLPLNHHHHRTIHLGVHQCRQWGLKLLALAEQMPLTDPKLPHDYSI